LNALVKYCEACGASQSWRFLSDSYRHEELDGVDIEMKWGDSFFPELFKNKVFEHFEGKI